MRLPAALALVALLAGCASAPGPDATDGGPPTTPVETPLAFDGQTPTGYCTAAAGNAGPCDYQGLEQASRVFEATGVLRLRGTLTWDAVSPASETLTLYVSRYEGGRFMTEASDPIASGTSPLDIDLDLSPLGNATAGLIVGNGVVAPIPTGFAAVQLPQPFRLDAVLTTAAPGIGP